MYIILVLFFLPLRFFLPLPSGLGSLFGFDIVVTPPVPLHSAVGQTIAFGVLVDHVDLAPVVGGLKTAANAVVVVVVVGDMDPAIPVGGDHILTDAIAVLVVDSLGTQFDSSLE